jgi:hypothetical protein
MQRTYGYTTAIEEDLFADVANPMLLGRILYNFARIRLVLGLCGNALGVRFSPFTESRV